MNKIFFSFLSLALLSSISFADCSCQKPNCDCQKDKLCPIEKQSCDNVKKSCDKCSIEDDEYCVFNQCFFDKQFKKMKKALCLDNQQECAINELYKNFKYDMEVLHSKYRVQKNKLLEMIACNNDCYKDQIEVVKDIKKDAKERCKCFKRDVKAQLCKSQYGDFRKFQRQEKRKMKKLAKYSIIHKLPCVDCCR